MYKPTSKLHEKLLSKSQPVVKQEIKKEPTSGDSSKKITLNANNQEKKRSNLELFKEELKR